MRGLPAGGTAEKMRSEIWRLTAAALIVVSGFCGCNGIPGGRGGGYYDEDGVIGLGPTGRARLFAKVVDSLNLPSDAGAIEPEPYRFLLGSVRGQREPALRKLTGEDLTYDGLMERPDRHRGKVMTAYGMVLEMHGHAAAPRGWRARGTELWSGLIGTLEGRIYAFRAVMPRGSKVPKLGRMVWFSGYFIKRFAFRGSDDGVHFAPLLVGPPPTLTDKGFPIFYVARKLGLDKFLPSRPCSERAVENRLVLELSGDGSVMIDGIPADDAEIAGRLDAEAARSYDAPGVRDWGVVLWFKRGTGRERLDELSEAVRSRRSLSAVLKVKAD